MKEMCGKEELVNLKKPSRLTTLREGLHCLGTEYSIGGEMLTSILEKQKQRETDIDSVIQQNNYYQTVDLLSFLLVNESTDHASVKQILDHHQQLYDEKKIDENQLNARSVEEGTLLKLRAKYQGSLVTRVCTNLIEQLALDENQLRPPKKRSVRSAVANLMTSMKTPKKKEDSALTEMRNMLEQRVITQEVYDVMVASHLRATEAEMEFGNERAALDITREKKEREAKERAKERAEREEQEVEVAKSQLEEAIANAKMCLDNDLISQEDHDGMVATAKAAFAEECGFEFQEDNTSSSSEKSSEKSSVKSSVKSSEKMSEKIEMVVGTNTQEDNREEESSGSNNSGNMQVDDNSSTTATSTVTSLADDHNMTSETKTKTKTSQNKNNNNVPNVRHRAISEVGGDLDSLCGYMMKKAKTMSQWRRRWFSVKRVYEPVSKQWCMSICWADDHNSPPKTTLPIDMISEIAKTELALTFKLIVPSPDGTKRRVILLRAETAIQQDAWVSALSKMVEEMAVRMKSNFLNNERRHSGMKFEDNEEQSIKSIAAVSPSSRKRKLKNGISKRTSLFEMPSKALTGTSSPVTNGGERPDINTLSTFDMKEASKKQTTIEEEDEEIVSVPASQGCGCVIS